MTYVLLEKKPIDFFPQIEVAACRILVKNTLLLLQNPQNKIEPYKWGLPGGKLEKNETPLEAAYRELAEETGLSLHTQLESIGCWYIRKPQMDYTLHLFHTQLDSHPEVNISSEHLAYMWVSLEELRTTSLMQGGYEIITTSL